jgi:hypothetical protein
MCLRVSADTGTSARSIMCRLAINPSPSIRSLRRRGDWQVRRRVKAQRRPRPQAFTGAQRVFRTHALYTPRYYRDPQRTRRLSYTIVAPPESHSACANLLPSLSDRYPGVACSEARSEPVSNCPSTYPRDPCPPPQPNLPLANSIYSL